MNTLTSGDLEYLEFYLISKNPLTNTEEYYNLTGASSINFFMTKYGDNTVSVSQTCEIVTATLGHCRVKITIPVAGEYEAELEVWKATEHITWSGLYYKVRQELG